MRDEDDPEPAISEAFDYLEQFGYFAFVEARGGFIEYEQLCVCVQCASQCDHLLDRDRVACDFPRDVDIDPQASHRLAGVLFDFAPADCTQGSWLAPQADVLRHRQMWNEIDFLVDRGDAQRFGVFGRSRMDGFSVQADLAFVAGIYTGQHFYQRGLPGSVLAHKRVDFARAECEVHTVQRLDAGKSLGNASHLQERMF